MSSSINITQPPVPPSPGLGPDPTSPGLPPGPSSFATDIRGSGFLKRRWLYHTVFWLAWYTLLMILYMGLHEMMTLSSGILYLIVLFFQAIFAYVNIYLLIPRLLFEKKYGYYALALLLNLVICAFVVVFVENAFSSLKTGKSDKLFDFKLNYLIILFVTEIYLIGMVTGMKFLKDSLLNQQRMKEKEKQYLETELKFLRSQIHPHFFFNTLNNIYSLTLKKSDEAPGIILKLSDLMSYMLYESNSPLVPLAKEINYLQNYLDVEQLRFGNRLSVSFAITGPVAEVNIPPMILILFLENSFKHGLKNNISKIHIDISLRTEKDFLYFTVDNPVTEDEIPFRSATPTSPDPRTATAVNPVSPDQPSTENKGIGLKNVRRRLDLLYGDSYTLDILIKDSIFRVSLKMPLC